MEDYNEMSIEIGERIREIRKLRGYTMRQLVDRMEELGFDGITENVVSMWELGKRRIFAEQLYYVALALECTPNMLLPTFSEEPNEQFSKLFTSFTKQEEEIFDFILTKWDGNTRALIQFLNLYAALPRPLRINIAETGVLMYEMGKKNKTLDPDAPEVNIAYIKEQTHLLSKEIHKEEELRKILKG